MSKKLQLEHKKIRWNEELHCIVIYNYSNCDAMGGVKITLSSKAGSDNHRSSHYAMHIRGANSFAKQRTYHQQHIINT
jgi:hypothetical protein